MEQVNKFDMPHDCCKSDSWMERLVDERVDILEKTIKLKNTLDDKEGLRLTNKEWRMLENQFAGMRDYLQALTDRCVYYNLIPNGNLYLDYGI